jgi:AbrB family looped-hinge helix DNA binding protein
MRELLTTVTRKGQITVPAEVRRALGLREGDRLAVILSDEERPEAILRPVASVAERTYGVVAPRGRPRDLKELRRLFEQGAAEEVMREVAPAPYDEA